MENLEKLRILLDHWIDHNKSHGADFEKWHQTMKDEGQTEIADTLMETMQKVDEISALLTSAMDKAGGKPDHKHHHHHHD